MADAGDTAGVEVFASRALAGLPHGFLGRRGGVSTGDVAGLNVGLGSGDDPQAVSRNRALAVAAVAPGARLATVYQVHSPVCVTVGDDVWEDGARPHADALVTDRPGVVLGILTADCAPVLFADPAAGVIGAAHAGWKGAYSGVIESTVAAMERLGARRSRIGAAIGPCIAAQSYEVDLAFRDRFLEQDASHAQFFADGREGHLQFALEAYVAVQMKKAKVGVIEELGQDTYTQEDAFYSYRRATHRAQPSYGRQFSLIALPCV